MKTHFVILGNTKTTNTKSKEIQDSFKEYATVISFIKRKKNESLEDQLKSYLCSYTQEKECTSLCLIPEEMVLNDKFAGIIKQYVYPVEEGAKDFSAFMPLVLAIDSSRPKTILNSCVYKPYMKPIELGMLDFDLALKQVDLSIWGMFIPYDLIAEIDFSVLKENDYKSYIHYVIIYLLLSKGFIQGIPKIIGDIEVEHVTSNLDKKEKLELFKKAQAFGEKIQAGLKN